MLLYLVKGKKDATKASAGVMGNMKGKFEI